MPRIWLPIALLTIVGIAMAVFLLPSGESADSAESLLERLRDPAQPTAAEPEVTHLPPEEITRSEATFEPIADRFALMEGGLVEVRILDLDGRPAPDRFLVTLEVLHPAPAGAGKDAKGTWSHHHRQARGGRALFAHAGFRQKVIARVRSEDGSFSAELEGISPIDADSVTTLELEPYLGKYILTGRVLNQEGEPGGNRKFHLIVETEDFIDSDVPVRTDAHGRFRWVMPHVLHPKEEQVLDLGVLRKGAGNNPPRKAAREGITLAGPGKHDLGDFILAPLGMLASGTVVDQDGTPLASIDLSFFRKDDSLDDMGFDRPSRLMLPGSTDHWTGRSEEDGTFAIHGEVRGNGDHVLQAWALRYRSQETPVKAGAKDVALILHEMIQVVAHLELDFGIDPGSLSIKLISHDFMEEGEPFETMGMVDDDGLLRFASVPAGEAVLLIESPILMEELFRLECEILGEEVEPDPNMLGVPLRLHDLGTIDLRGELLAVSLRIRDAKGNPVDRPWIWIEPWDTGEYVNPLEVTLVRSEKTIDLLVGADDFPYQFVGDVRTNLTVTLKKGLEFQVKLDDSPLHSDAWSLVGGVFLDQRTDRYWDPFSREEPPAYWGQVVRPGSYRVSFYLYHLQEDGEWDEGNAIAAEYDFPLIEILDSEELQVFEVPWRQWHLERTMEWVLEQENKDKMRMEESLED